MPLSILDFHPQPCGYAWCLERERKTMIVGLRKMAVLSSFSSCHPPPPTHTDDPSDSLPDHALVSDNDLPGTTNDPSDSHPDHPVLA